MSIRKCPSHGGYFRKGVRVLLVDAAGKVATKLVCPACAARGVTVVATVVAPVVKKAVAPDERIKEITRQLTGYAKAAAMSQERSKALMDLTDASYHAGRQAAYESAIELLKKLKEPS